MSVKHGEIEPDHKQFPPVSSARKGSFRWYLDYYLAWLEVFGSIQLSTPTTSYLSDGQVRTTPPRLTLPVAFVSLTVFDTCRFPAGCPA